MTNKKFWALLIAVVMMISVFSLCALAADDEGTLTLTSVGATEDETMTITSTEEPTEGSEETETKDPTETSAPVETTDTTTTGETTEETTEETTTTEKKSWFAEHINFVIAVAVVVFLVVLYFAIRLFSKKFREKTDKFWKDYNAEFKKLVWPTKQQLWKNSAVVLVTLVVCAAVLALIDFGLGKGVTALKDWFDLIRPVS